MLPFIFPIVAAVLQAASFTVDKLAMNIKRFNYKNYTVISFPLIFIFTLAIFFIFRPEFSTRLFEGVYFWLILATIILGVFANIIYYRVLKSEHLGEMQTLSLLNRIPLILFAGFFFIDERNYLTMTFAIVAALSIVWSHWEKHHFHIAKKTWPYFIWTLAVAPLGGIISKKLLEIWNPISLHLVTSGVEAIFFIFLFHSAIMKTPKKAIAPLLITNLLTTIAWILYFYSFQKSGIIFTVLVFSLQPLLVYFSSIFFLKEKLHWKKLIALLIVLVSIGASQVL